MDPSPYLTPPEAARALGVSERTLRRRIDAGDVPTLWVTGTTRRIEARAVLDDHPAPDPPRALTLHEVATWLRCAPNTVRVAVAEERLRPRPGAGGRRFSRAEILRFLSDFTTGDE